MITIELPAMQFDPTMWNDWTMIYCKDSSNSFFCSLLLDFSLSKTTVENFGPKG